MRTEHRDRLRADRSLGLSVTVEREVPFAIERAFHAWVDSRLLARWLVPCGGTVSSAIVDPREGGHYRIEGHLAEGVPFSISGIYLVIDAPTRLAMSWRFDGAAGPAQDEASIVTVEFVARCPKLTGVTVTHERTEVQGAIELPQSGCGDAAYPPKAIPSR